MASPPAAEQQSTVEEKVLELVAGKSLRTSDLMNVATDHDLSPADVREAVWTLLDDGRLAFTSDRHLVIR